MTRLRSRRPVRRHDHVEEVEFQRAAHRELPANASKSALLTLAEAQKHGAGAGTLLLSGWDARVGYEADETIRMSSKAGAPVSTSDALARVERESGGVSG